MFGLTFLTILYDGTLKYPPTTLIWRWEIICFLRWTKS